MGLKSFLHNSRGNMAMMMGIAAVPMLMATGAAVDMVRFNNANTALQGAADAAAIAAATSRQAIDQAALDLIVHDYLDANGAHKLAQNLSSIDQQVDPANGTLTVTVKGTMKTEFMSITGIPALDLISTSKVKVGQLALEQTRQVDAMLRQ
jgi:Flp pilus assembly protein TadG